MSVIIVLCLYSLLHPNDFLARVDLWNGTFIIGRDDQGVDWRRGREAGGVLVDNSGAHLRGVDDGLRSSSCGGGRVGAVLWILKFVEGWGMVAVVCYGGFGVGPRYNWRRVFRFGGGSQLVADDCWFVDS